jgi:4-diphosphocytidyl-2-C-methyl-D-erythritol kinase
MASDVQRRARTVRPPAKLNLGLEIVGQRPDGYHEIRSIMQTVSQCDELRLQVSELSLKEVAVIRSVSAEEPRLSLAGHELAAESNLVVRALRALADH